MTPTPDKVLIDRVIAGRLIDAAGFARQLAVGKLNSEGWDRIADHLRQALAAQPKAPSPIERVAGRGGAGMSYQGYERDLARLLELHGKEKEACIQIDQAQRNLKFVRAEMHDLTDRMIAESKKDRPQ